MVTCKNCGCELQDEAKFCRECGAEVVKEEPVTESQFCTKCGFEMPKGINYCPECGALTAHALENKNAQSNTNTQTNTNTQANTNAQSNTNTQTNNAAPQNYTVQPIVNQKSAGLAAVLSFFIIGLGQIYIGLTKKGIILFFAAIIAGFLTIIIIGWIIWLLVWFYAIYDAYNSANKINQGIDVEDTIDFHNLF